MASLFIVGNGFDLSHGLHTTYNDFKEYLLSEHPNAESNGFIVPSGTQLPDGGIEYNKEEVISMLIHLINEAENNDMDWHNVEQSLGYLNFDDAFDWLDDIHDKEGDIDYWKMAQRNEDTASNLVIPASKIQEFFSEWVGSIYPFLIESKTDFRNLLGDQDQFLTFNYTETLEEVYDIASENVCHIHGTGKEEIFFGHGNTEDYSEDYMKKHIGSENDLSRINEQLKKRTDKAFQRNQNFFENLTDKEINKIYSFGFSFNKVDMLYLEEICKRLNTKYITWYFNDYDIESIGEWLVLLKQSGFKGDFNIFHVD